VLPMMVLWTSNSTITQCEWDTILMWIEEGLSICIADLTIFYTNVHFYLALFCIEGSKVCTKAYIVIVLIYLKLKKYLPKKYFSILNQAISN